jgi:hypothetical protein
MQGDNDISDTQKYINLFCFNANVPGISFSTNDQYIDVDTKRHFVYDADKTDVRLSFYADQQMNIRMFFEKWMKFIVSKKRTFGYPSDYSTEIQVNIKNMQDKSIMTYVLKDAFPKTLSEIELNWSGMGQISTFSTEFCYSYMDIKKSDETFDGGAVKDSETLPTESDEGYSATNEPQYDQLGNFAGDYQNIPDEYWQ